MLFFNLSSANLYPTHPKQNPTSDPALPLLRSIPPFSSSSCSSSTTIAFTLFSHTFSTFLGSVPEPSSPSSPSTPTSSTPSPLPPPPLDATRAPSPSPLHSSQCLRRLKTLSSARTLEANASWVFSPRSGLVCVAWSSPEISGVVGRLVSRKAPLLSLKDAGFDCWVVKWHLVNEVVKKNAKSSVLF